MEKGKAVKVGIFVLATLILLAGSILWFQSDFLKPMYRIVAYFPDVSGLSVDAPVYYMGVKVGRIKRITPTLYKGVETVILIKKDILIPKGSYFSIGTYGLVGDKFISITPPKSITKEYLTDGATVIGTSPPTYEDILNETSVLLVRVSNLTKDLHDTLLNPESKESIKKTLFLASSIATNIDRFTRVLSDLAYKNESDVNQTISNLRGFSEYLLAISKNIDKGVSDPELFPSIKSALLNINEASKNVANLASNLNDIVKDKKTKEEIKQTITNASEITERSKKVLDYLANTKITPQVRVFSGPKDRREGAFFLDIHPPGDRFYRFGVRDSGGKTKVDAQAGQKINDNLDVRIGYMNSHLGAGLDVHYGRFGVESEIYDPKRTTLDSILSYSITKDVDLLMYLKDLTRSDREVLGGVRYKFDN
ncbi:phospholipid/cholesterol/gamma-HCH transport system substrate-binding protein [Thermodesulfobium acidiphilum]|uniref:Phospholipid/cholesterol/gamma-HCH transport system substrate-binding protein n=1 Tax=Thermodesulfobium acidiphilum TaxID=1794699 RepID=A0A2R4VYI9_THEAF|nr:MlaD family protein [Thermodesulfobium acidiphilum]AWB09603.1 phospholipid/cholesterol/gamma-HCH transport system substrate-binding protein [Thermodesulfobium acidiphilum]